MERDDGLGEEEPIPPLLPPDDRLWRHPSEIALHPFAGRSSRGRREGPRIWPVAGLSGLIGALLATGVLAAGGMVQVGRDTIRTVVQREASPLAVPVAAGAGIVDIADKIRPAVVELRAVGSEEPMGSGVVFRSDGWIVTSHQVVVGLVDVAVVLADGTTETGRVAGRNPDTNIAVIKLDRKDMTTAALGSVASLKVGQVAVVVGTTLSVGVISALGREVRVPKGPLLLDMIQTDAPVAPGAAGGALLDSGGGVIGIATSVEGASYATPIDAARDVAEQLITTGKVVHAWLGVEGDALTPAEARALGLDAGAVIRRVRPGSPADAVGLAAKDVIVSVDGATIGSMTALKVLLRSKRPGQAIDIAYVRDGKQAHAVATLTPRPTA